MASPDPSAWRMCVAPMMDFTDRHCRYFHRLLAPHARLYTEMITADALIRGDRRRLLEYSAAEHPVALQVGGCDPASLAKAARHGADAGYDEVNLNVGCPSDRVQSGRFGACLMREPALVAECVRAMQDAVRVPVTVKCRIGVDDQDSEADLYRFAGTMVGAGVRTLIVHARKAWLRGLSPRENREIPPLDHDRVYRLKREFPSLTVVINGGIVELAAVRAHLARVDGVMLGRLACHDPYSLARIDTTAFGGEPPSRRAVLERMRPYIEAELARGTRLHSITRHVAGLYRNQPGGRAFRRVLSEGARADGAGWERVRAALAMLPGADRSPPPPRRPGIEAASA
jgi:tRNA-dihydrouridine synthase A